MGHGALQTEAVETIRPRENVLSDQARQLTAKLWTLWFRLVYRDPERPSRRRTRRIVARISNANFAVHGRQTYSRRINESWRIEARYHRRPRGRYVSSGRY